MYRKIAILLIIVLPGFASAQPPDAEAQRQQELAKKPQWQRLLSGDDAKMAEELRQKINRLTAEDDYQGASDPAKELHALREKSQGADHWETVNAKFGITRIEILANKPPAQRQKWRIALRGAHEARAMEDDEQQYAKAYHAQMHYSELCMELLGEDHPTTALGFNNLAYNLYSQGKFVEAQPLHNKALEIRLRLLGENHPDTANSCYNMADNLSAMGKSAEARPLYQKALEINRRLLGEEHRITAATYNVVAFNLNALGKTAEAQTLYQKALDIRRKVLGEDHIDTAVSCSNVAVTLSSQGNALAALPLYQKALDIRRKVLGDDHIDTAVSYSDVALTLSSLGKALEALPLSQKTLIIRRKVLGEDHPKTAESYHNIADNLISLGKASEAQTLLLKALDIHRRVLGEDHPNTAVCYGSLAVNLNSLGKTAEAQPLLLKALDIHRRVNGEDHLNTARSYNSLAFNLQALGKAAEAQPLYQKALETRLGVLGENHPDTAMCYNYLATNLSDMGKPAEAHTLYQKALEINRRVLGEVHPSTANNFHNSATSFRTLGKVTEAQSHYQKALEIFLQVFGEDHPYTAMCYGSFAISLNDQGKAGEAQLYLQKALEFHCRMHGNDHPETARSYNNVATNLVALGRRIEAETILRSAVFAYESSRLTGAVGIDRAALDRVNPRLLLAVLTQANEPRSAWSEIELSLARGLLDQQADSQRKLELTDESELSEERQRVSAAQPQILALVTKGKRTEVESVQLERLLSERKQSQERLSTLAVKLSTQEVARGDAIQSALPVDAALLLWVDVSAGGVQEHCACVVRRTGDPKWERLPAASGEKWTKDDIELPGKLRSALANSAPLAEVSSLTYKLEAQRIAPVLKHLEGVKTLYVVAVNDMAGVPVELLAPQFTVSYVPSGTFLARRGKQPEKPQTLLALGDPVFPESTAKIVSTALPPGGLLITQVVPGGTAAQALLKPDDVLVSYAGTELNSLEQLLGLIAAKAAEKSVAIQIWRESENKLATYNIPPGRLGAVIAKEPAREAIAARRKSDQVLASLTRGEWGELPGSQVELSELAKLFGPQAATTLTRSDASEPALDKLRKAGDLGKFRYLHFATHGEANNVRAFDSKLILAQDHPVQLIAAAGEPWFNNELSAQEVLNHWKLDAELVTLSACETALGKNAGGDGMLGFAQAFLVAGSRAVCLSLWKVDDTATTLLMDRFYRNLLGKREDGAQPLGKAAALAEAKTWLKNLSVSQAADRLGVLTDGVSRGSKTGRKVLGEIPAPADASPESKPYAHPKYWAAFILIGDPD